MSKNDPCPLCGETDFTWGRIVAPDFSFTESRSMFAMGKEVEVRRCNTCGNLQFFTEIPKTREKSKRKRGE